MAGGLKEELSVTAGEADAFSQLVENARRPRPKPEFGGGALERRSISEQVANRILSMIKSGNLKSGDRLPTEAQMGIAFGISRPPLREALKALTLMGVLESRQGGRYTATHRRDFVPWRFSDAGRRSAWLDRRCRRPKTCTGGDIPWVPRCTAK